WALGIFWRKDGTALWPDATLLDTPAQPGKAKPTGALRFAKALCDALQLDPRYLVAGFEDQDYYLQREGRLPVDVNVRDSQLKDEQERERLRRVFDHGLATKVGYALPLAWSGSEKRGSWRSSRWQFRRQRMFLTPGDSPMGLRLPLDSLPWRIARDYDFELDPFNEHGPLQAPVLESTVKGKAKRRTRMERIIHTALCVQVRDGHLYLFMPPLRRLEYYVQLCQAIAAVAAALRQPVIIEGYEPPRDPRLRKLLITPDPGVIEVNVQPAANWRELTNIVSTLYASARECRLGTEKFMLDGKHTGTGGGNHVTMGAARAEQSPFLRRPDLLGSLLRYWQNHPALSYLFSGQFIGPTSQAPRVDEARDDNLYELEIALQQLPKNASDKPWLVDRILRNLLVDLTGNTHRSEFCIDKLYSPQGSAGRLGLVEFRNFEMPPHWQMSMVQLLLLRALVAWFWNAPYTRPLIRWGGQLRDRFMLPHYIEQDWRQVVQDLNDAGFAFAPEWLLPFQEFRFPHYGRCQVAGLQLDLHGAVEPWHVLGEETSGSGTSRYVDSSVERLQVMVSGVMGNRLALYCNGRRVPLQPTARDGEFVAGVRYKAWAPWSALHPTIGVHTPLTLEVVDLAQRRSLGGCQYHVGHPGGRNYDTFPVNANEAEARRTARFTVQGHRQGRLRLQDTPTHDAFPCTLDLRYGDHSRT
ncbi:MAG TPA: transglutaminase family protein, partial [Hyphomicrobiales bacterium]|nr:transglutaminase family protein [Hyphomicrobiales bacterium]